MTILVTDPFFYAVAIPAVFLLGLSKSGFGSGFGALAVPMIALAVPVPQAAAILVPVLLVLDILGLHAWRRHFDWGLIRFLLPFGLLGTAIGTLLFRSLDARLVAGIVGAFTLAFLAQRLVFPPRADAPPPPRWQGGLFTTLAGFTSFIAHAGGPPLNAYVLKLKLRPQTYTASMAVFFFAINVAKWGPYAWLGLLDLRNVTTSLALLPLSPLGVYVGVRIANRMDATLFYRLINLGMFLAGCKLVWDGFLAGRI
ncbi:sulfite exporter TauE/SafE family protein [Ramlibacter sp. AW1]|uniref:Probable membrane transporter protein n=1 Tax=Ramlibacter aurantiacus TaxID=2801330 RepID=A0A936ZL06_9BURK|nr:sulfite exporter TauE/SafE family protein [Ramlibacter aurantiacus]MBL0422143.1 sulfite exporter TauE/SafE family protein [Ramlibacter aurantiacus]